MINDKGKEILQHATSQDECVLLFRKNSDGEDMMVMDVTDHFRTMEKLIEGHELSVESD